MQTARPESQPSSLPPSQEQRSAQSASPTSDADRTCQTCGHKRPIGTTCLDCLRYQEGDQIARAVRDGCGSSACEPSLDRCGATTPGVAPMR